MREDMPFIEPFCSDVPGVFPNSLRLPFVEGFPSADKLKRLKAWLSANSDKYANRSVVLYHSTGLDVPVLAEGLKPTSATRRRSFQSAPGYVYLAATPERAHRFGLLGNSNRARVYAVNVFVRNLLADRDQLNNQRSVGHQVNNSVAESILWGGGVRVKGSVSPWDIAEVFQGPNAKFQCAPFSDADRGRMLHSQAAQAAKAKAYLDRLDDADRRITARMQP